MSAARLPGAVSLAQESLDDIDQGKAQAASAQDPVAAEGGKAVAEVNGYVDNRLSFSWIDPSVPLPTGDAPSFQEILEGNIQLKVSFGQKAFAYADVSLFFQRGWLYYTDDGKGGRTTVPDHDVASLRPFFVPSELYASYSPRPWLNLLVGKKRIIWGSGLAFNPTDLINPPKDPTDPNFQRAGSWVARVEAPFEKFTLTGLFSPGVLYQQDGVPYSVLRYPDYPSRETVQDPTRNPDSRDDSSHFLVAARLYMLLYDSDINLMYYFSNRYHDGFENKSRLGASFSRYFFTDYELHIEALLQQGSARSFPDHVCALTGQHCFSIGPGGAVQQNAASPSRLDSSAVYPRLLVGTRRQFSDESLLSAEYYYQADGFSSDEMQDAIRLLARVHASGFGPPATGGQTPMQGGALPTRFSFDPLRRHYLILSYTKPKIRDDFTIGAVLIASLNDLSGLLTPSVSWNAREWLNLTLFGFIPIRGITDGHVTVAGASYPDSEYSLFPIDWRVLFEARAFY